MSIVIHDPDDPRLTAYRSLKGKELEREGIFIAEGEKVVRCMLAGGGCRIASCLTAADAVPRYRPLLAAIRKTGAPVYVAAGGVVADIIGFRFHKGIMAAGYCPEKRPLAGVIKTLKAPLLLVALNGVNDPQNVGLIARNAAALGAQALIVDGASYDPYYRKAVRVSMGTIFDLPVCYENDLRSVLVRLKKDGVRVIAATTGKGSIAVSDADLSGSVCLVFGNEDMGVTRGVLRIADEKVRIPIKKTVDSLNVASAAAVLLHAAARV